MTRASDYERAASLLPLPQATLNILLALAEGEAHGYGIKRAVEERTAGTVRMGAGTLYTALQRAAEGGLIEEADPPAGEEPASPRWRYYRLSSFGRQVLGAELERLERIVTYARERALISRAEVS